MGDVPGVCAVPLTRAIVQYRAVHEMDLAGSRVSDIGMGLVMDGRYAAAAEVLDLGSGRLKVLDLSRELVILDWAYEPTHEHLQALLAADGEEGEARRYGFRMAMGVLGRVGFGPLTRPVLLRIGYRDVCRDFDLHEETSIRIVLGAGRVVRAHLDYDDCALVFRTAMHAPDRPFERAVMDAFPGAAVRRVDPSGPEASLRYRVAFELPGSVREVRSVVSEIRDGLAHLTARFEPDRFRAVAGLVQTFGARETLSGLEERELGGRDLAASALPFASAALH
jgi:hypothetical protein